jgi:hypothetical protein
MRVRISPLIGGKFRWRVVGLGPKRLAGTATSSRVREQNPSNLAVRTISWWRSKYSVSAAIAFRLRVYPTVGTGRTRIGSTPITLGNFPIVPSSSAVRQLTFAPSQLGQVLKQCRGARGLQQQNHRVSDCCKWAGGGTTHHVFESQRLQHAFFCSTRPYL